MKSHISATISPDVLESLKELGQKERRTLSNLIELAVVQLLEKNHSTQAIVTSEGRCDGKLSRQEIYDRDSR